MNDNGFFRLVLMCLCIGLSRVSLAASATQPAMVFPLSTVVPPTIKPLTRGQAARLMAPFKHVGFDESGFNALSIPFHFQSPDHSGDPAEADAFAFLLSDNLDWSPGCYCARHAYFVFKEDTANMRALQRNYDPISIKEAVQGWGATHAIGGILTHTAKGYCGTLKIFDAQGLTVRSIDYAAPRSFFDLLGDMTVDAMTVLDQKPSDALAVFLHKPIGTHPESLAILGKGAFSKRMSKEDFDGYDSVLKLDPTFAPVRHWYANQKYWSKCWPPSSQEDALQARYVDTAIALNDRVNPGYFADVDPNTMKDRALAAKYDEWIQTAEDLAGPDVPDLINARWDRRWAETEDDVTQILHATDVAHGYPNHAYLLDVLAVQFANLSGPFCDDNMGIALKLTALNSRFLPGNDDRPREYTDIASYLRDLGHWVPAAACARQALAIDAGYTPAKRLLIEADVQLGLYNDAIELAKRNPQLVEEDSGNIANCIAFAHATIGDVDGLETFIADHPHPEKMYCPPVYKTYLEILRGTFAGDAAGINTRWAQLMKEPGAQWADICLVLCQLDMMHGSRAFETYVSWGLAEKPNDRRLWFLFDRYRQMIPDPKGDDFHVVLARLYPEDPWCQEAAARFMKAAPHAKPVDPQNVAKALSHFPTARWPMGDPKNEEHARTLCKQLYPWFAASAMFQRIDAGDLQGAREIAYRYHFVAATARLAYTRAYVNQLIHVAEEATPAAPRQ
ncbi:MAG TPA: hypothetical protein VM008_04915 [Phycisphaerae bacterium]|nr:hypothetical protein [Phycisphaerae bacterium]